MSICKPFIHAIETDRNFRVIEVIKMLNKKTPESICSSAQNCIRNNDNLLFWISHLHCKL